MPRHRSEERSSRSSSPSSYSSPRTERSSSRPRTSSASRSRSSHTSARSSPSPRPTAASSPSLSTERSSPRASSYRSPPKTEKSTPRTSSNSQSPKQTVYHDYSSSGSSSGEGNSFGFIDAIKDAFRSQTASKADTVATKIPTEKSTPRTATYIPPPHDDYYDASSTTSRRSREVAYGIVDGILDAIFPSRTASKADPVSAPSVPEVTNDTGSIACVTQAKTFQDCLDEFETDISKCQSYMDIWCKCKKNYKKSSDSTLTA